MRSRRTGQPGERLTARRPYSINIVPPRGPLTHNPGGAARMAGRPRRFNAGDRPGDPWSEEPWRIDPGGGQGSSASDRYPIPLTESPAIFGPFHARFRAVSTTKSGVSTPFSGLFDPDSWVRPGSFSGVLPLGRMSGAEKRCRQALIDTVGTVPDTFSPIAPDWPSRGPVGAFSSAFER
jgi:hypothetical protein